MGRDYYVFIPKHRLATISIHAPVWGATIMSLYLSIGSPPFQSTRPYGARPNKQEFATKLRLEISIHAPVWGATAVFFMLSQVFLKFQSTRPYGARLNMLCNAMPPNTISIHAPVWGATDGKGILPTKCGISIHAPVWGATRL